MTRIDADDGILQWVFSQPNVYAEFYLLPPPYGEACDVHDQTLLVTDELPSYPSSGSTGTTSFLNWSMTSRGMRTHDPSL